MRPKKQIEHHTIKAPAYHNYKVLDQQDRHIFNCAYKKACWYLDRNLAEIVQEDPLVIRLTFQTKGSGHLNDPYFLQKLENRCVVCGIEKELTRHHIVPFCYRHWMIDEIKDHNHYDVLLMCLNCHQEYETISSLIKKQIIQQYAIVNQSKYSKELAKVVKSACAILKHADKIPVKRKDDLLDVLRAHYEKIDIGQADIEEASKIKFIEYTSKTDAQLVMEQVIDVEAFIKRWRQHFIDTMKPAYLPKFWSVDRSIKRD